MRIALDDLGLEHIWVIYPGDASYELDERISVIPVDAVPGLCRSLRER